MPGYGGDVFLSTITIADMPPKIIWQATVENKLVLPDTTVEWLEPLESAEHLRKILAVLQKEGVSWRSTDRTAMIYKAEEKSPEVLVEELLQILFSAHILLVEKINKKPFSVKVPWDNSTGLPSPPTLAADAGAFAQISESLVTVSYMPRNWALAKSFGNWQLFCRENMRCACGSGMRLKEIPLKILTTTTVGKSGSRLRLENFVGVMAEDMPHLKNHYSFSEIRREDPFIRVVSRIEADIWKDKERGEIWGGLLSAKSANEFNQKLFGEEAKKTAEKFIEAVNKVNR